MSINGLEMCLNQLSTFKTPPIDQIPYYNFDFGFDFQPFLRRSKMFWQRPPRYLNGDSITFRQTRFHGLNGNCFLDYNQCLCPLKKSNCPEVSHNQQSLTKNLTIFPKMVQMGHILRKRSLQDHGEISNGFSSRAPHKNDF